jgi:CRISPR/Cas system-associated exonuclease Cas4 (RecB family)
MVSQNTIPSHTEIIEHLQQEWKQTWDTAIHLPDAFDQEHYRQLAETYLSNFYHRLYPFNQDKILGIDQKITLYRQGYRLIGFIDRLTQPTPETIVIHEYKTTRKHFETLPNKTRLQVLLYAYAIHNQYPQIQNITAVLYFLAHEKEISIKCTHQDLLEIQQWIETTISHIEQTQSYPKKSSSLCQWCQYQELCKIRLN